MLARWPHVQGNMYTGLGYHCTKNEVFHQEFIQQMRPYLLTKSLMENFTFFVQCILATLLKRKIHGCKVLQNLIKFTKFVKSYTCQSEYLSARNLISKASLHPC